MIEVGGVFYYLCMTKKIKHKKKKLTNKFNIQFTNIKILLYKIKHAMMKSKKKNT